MAYKVSIRISIRWLPKEASEPTDTLVFGVGSYYLDLRVRKDNGTIDWALAGEKQVISKDPLKCRWIHTIDSLGRTDYPDEGSFVDLPNGDSLETGSMACPERNDEITEYEEAWRVIEPVPGPKRAWILESVDDERKTFLGRIGGGYMALVAPRKNLSFGARSEEWNASKQTWSTKHEIGGVEGIPSLSKQAAEGFAGEEGWKEGGEIQLLGRQYVVRAYEALK